MVEWRWRCRPVVTWSAAIAETSTPVIATMTMTPTMRPVSMSRAETDARTTRRPPGGQQIRLNRMTVRTPATHNRKGREVSTAVAHGKEGTVRVHGGGERTHRRRCRQRATPIAATRPPARDPRTSTPSSPRPRPRAAPGRTHSRPPYGTSASMCPSPRRSRRPPPRRTGRSRRCSAPPPAHPASSTTPASPCSPPRRPPPSSWHRRAWRSGT